MAAGSDVQPNHSQEDPISIPTQNVSLFAYSVFFWKVSLPSIASFSPLLPFFFFNDSKCAKRRETTVTAPGKKKESNSTKKAVYLKKNGIFVSGCFLSLKATKSFERTRLPDCWY